MSSVVPTWLWSDQHFGHVNILSYSSRPFRNITEHDETLIQNYNAVVKPHDVVLWIGDAFLARTPYPQHVMSRLSGYNILIRGNHDGTVSRCREFGFEQVWDRHEFEGFQCTHFPYGTVHKAKHLPVPKRQHGVTLLHGHTHSVERTSEGAVHVGVDAWGYRPVHIDEIKALIGKKQ